MSLTHILIVSLKSPRYTVTSSSYIPIKNNSILNVQKVPALFVVVMLTVCAYIITLQLARLSDDPKLRKRAAIPGDNTSHKLQSIHTISYIDTR